MAQINDVYEMRVYCRLNDQTSINVRHFLIENVTGTGQTDQQIADQLSTLYGPLYRNLLSDDAIYYGLSIQRIVPKPPSVASFSTNQQGTGSVVGEALPMQVCGIITLRTLFAGRRFRGRLYVPFPGESSNDANQTPNAGYNTNLLDLAGNLVGTIVAGAAPNTVVLRHIVYGRVGDLVTPINVARPVDRWATQRRRGSFGRPNSPPF